MLARVSRVLGQILTCGVCAAALAASAAASFTQSGGGAYWLFVASEAADKIALRAVHARRRACRPRIATGIMPADDRRSARPRESPDGALLRVAGARPAVRRRVEVLDPDRTTVVGRVTLGMFPATMQRRPGRRVSVRRRISTCMAIACPRRVSVVDDGRNDGDCARPNLHDAARIARQSQGTRHYSACMMDDMLVEIDTAHASKVSRHFILTKGQRSAGCPDPEPAVHAGGRPVARLVRPRNRGAEGPANVCSPTWAQPSADGPIGIRRVQRVERDRRNRRRRLDARGAGFQPAHGIYNLAVTRRQSAGRDQQAATNRCPSSTSQDLRERARIQADARRRSRRRGLAGRPLRLRVGRRHWQRARHRRDDRPEVAQDRRQRRCRRPGRRDRFLGSRSVQRVIVDRSGLGRLLASRAAIA